MTDDEADVSVRGRGTSIVSYRFGGREYPLKTVPRCRVCMHPKRFDIESAVVAGRVYRRIADDITALGEQYAVTTRNVIDHYNNGHMPLELSDTRAIVDARAQQVGKDIESGTESLIDGVSLLSTVVAKTFEGIAAGTIQPGIRDGIRAAKMLADLGEYDGASVDQQSFVSAFIAYHETAEKMMSAEEFKEFGKMLDEHPVLAALASRYEGETVPGEVTGSSEEPVE